MNKKGSIKKKLSKNMFLLDVKTDKPNMGFFRAVFKFKIEKELYKYDKGKLIFYKNLAKLYKSESIKDICQISENKYVFYTNQKDDLEGTNNYLIFYDMEKERKIKQLKITEKEIDTKEMCLINEDNLLITGNDDTTILIDTKNRVIKNEFKYNISLSEIILLNENRFLYKTLGYIHQYEFDDKKTLQLKGKKKLKGYFITKFPGNKLAAVTEEKIIIIYG